MIPIELLIEVYIIKYQRRGVPPWNESHITFTLWVSRIARHINQFRSRSFVMSLSVHKEDVVRMSLVEPSGFEPNVRKNSKEKGLVERYWELLHA